MVHWLDTSEGKASEELAGRVYERLDFFKVDAEKRLFQLEKTMMLLDQVVEKVAADLNAEANTVREHVLRYMMEASDSANPELEGTQEYVDMVQAWAEEECEKYEIVLRF